MGTRGRILFIQSQGEDPQGELVESYVACLTCWAANPRGDGEGVLDSIERVLSQSPETRNHAKLLAAHLVAGDILPTERGLGRFLPGVLGPRPILDYEYLVVCRRKRDPEVFIQSGTMWKTEAQFSVDADTRCRPSTDAEAGGES